MAKRSYGTGSLFIKGDKWYGRWWVGAQRVKRLLGPVRRPGSTDGLTRTQAERELRRRIEDDAMVVRSHSRRTLADAGARYVDHLEHVTERKRTTIQDYRGYLSGHLVAFFGDRPIERIEPAHITAYLKHARTNGRRSNGKGTQGLSSKTVQNHLTFLHELFAFAKKRK